MDGWMGGWDKRDGTEFVSEGETSLKSSTLIPRPTFFFYKNNMLTKTTPERGGRYGTVDSAMFTIFLQAYTASKAATILFLIQHLDNLCHTFSKFLLN